MATSKQTAGVSQQYSSFDYQNLFDALPAGYIAFLANDPLFTIVAENAKHAEVAMVTPLDAIGRPLFEVFPDTSEKYTKTGVSDLIESLRRVIQSGEPDSMPTLQYDLKAPDGTMTPKYWRLTHYPVLDTAGKVSLVFQATTDITKEVLAGDQLGRTQLQLKEALSSGMIGTWLWDMTSDSIIGDSNMADMFGLDAKQAAIGLPLTAFTSAMYPDDRPRVQAEIARALQSGREFRSEYRTISRTGSIRWLLARGRVERDLKGKPINFPGVLVDITERKLAENNLFYLANASAVLSTSLNYKKTLSTIAKLMVPDIADWCSIELIGNDGQLEQVAVAHRDPSKVSWAIEYRKQQGAPNLDDPTGVANVIRTGKPEFVPSVAKALEALPNVDPEALKLVEELALTSIIIVPLVINQKTLGAITLIISDSKRTYTESDLKMAEELANRASLAITNASLYQDARRELIERNRLEKALRSANDELEVRVAARTSELEQSNQSLQRSNQELQDFAYVASHDLQEPLRKIQAFGNLLETEYGDAIGEGVDYLTRMRKAAARMSTLIEDLLAFSRVTSKGREFCSVNLHTVVKEVIDDLEVRIADTKATIKIGELPTIHADAMQMRQLLQNLIANALKFSRVGIPPIVQIRIVAMPKSTAKIKYCQLEIEDNGLGFDEKYLDRIFAVFQRLHTRDSFEGTGIGLAVCRKIVERHGGSITARSKLGHGSTFIILLPLRHKKGDCIS